MRTSIFRGLRCFCPACGRGRLYRTYLKPYERCEICGAPIGAVRADDGPTWLTVLALGPVLIFLTMAIARSSLSPWIGYPLLSGITLILVIGVLPRMKGLVIGALWSIQN